MDKMTYTELLKRIKEIVNQECGESRAVITDNGLTISIDTGKFDTVLLIKLYRHKNGWGIGTWMRVNDLTEIKPEERQEFEDNYTRLALAMDKIQMEIGDTIIEL